MKHFIGVLFIIFFLLSCNFKKEKDFEVINNVLPELFIKDYSFESFKDYKHRLYAAEEIDKINFDSLYNEYEKNKKLKKTLTLFIKDTLTPIKNKTLKLVLNIDDYDLKPKKEVKFNPIKKIKLPKGISLSSYEDATVARYEFSRVYINKNNNKAFFVLKFDCLNGCYSEQIIYLYKDNDKWFFDRDQILLAV